MSIFGKPEVTILKESSDSKTYLQSSKSCRRQYFRGVSCQRMICDVLDAILVYLCIRANAHIERSLL